MLLAIITVQGQAITRNDQWVSETAEIKWDCSLPKNKAMSDCMGIVIEMRDIESIIGSALPIESSGLSN